MTQKIVLMIAPLFPPNMAAGAHRTLRFVKYLNEFGWKVVVITKGLPDDCDPAAVARTLGPICGAGLVEIIRVNGNRQRASCDVQVNIAPDAKAEFHPVQPTMLRRNIVVESGKNLLRPLWQFFEQTPDMERGWSRLAAKAAIQRCQQGGIDAIYSTGPPHSVHLAGLIVGRTRKLPFIADFRDPWARNSWVRGRNPIGRRVLPLLERLVVKSAAKVIANNDGSLASFEAAYPVLARAGRFVTITNGFDPEVEVAYPAERPDHTAVITAVHAGSFYAQRSPRPLIAAIAELAKSGLNIEFHHIGTYDQKFDPIAIACELGCESSVRWLGKLSHTETLARLSHADLLVAIQPNAPFQIPGKVFEMLLFDQPILAICESPPTEKVVRQAGGATAPSDDVQGIAEAMRAAIAMRGTAELSTRRCEARALYNGRELTRSLAFALDEAMQPDI